MSSPVIDTGKVLCTFGSKDLGVYTNLINFKKANYK